MGRLSPFPPPNLLGLALCLLAGDLALVLHVRLVADQQQRHLVRLVHPEDLVAEIVQVLKRRALRQRKHAQKALLRGGRRGS